MKTYVKTYVKQFKTFIKKSKKKTKTKHKNSNYIPHTNTFKYTSNTQTYLKTRRKSKQIE